MLGRKDVVCQICGKNQATKTVAGAEFCDECFEKLNGITKGNRESFEFYNNFELLQELPNTTRVYIKSLLDKSIWKVEFESEVQKQEQLKKLQEDQLKKRILVTMTDSFETKKIIKYIDMVSGACAMGTGLFTELGGEITDFFGEQSNMFQDKIRKARDVAEYQMRQEAFNKGANAIVCVRYNYWNGKNNMAIVAVNGTAVQTVEKEENTATD